MKRRRSVALGPFLPVTERMRHRPIAVNGCAWARRSSKWDHLSVCHVLVSLAVERTAAAVESSSLQGHFCLVWFASDGKASNRFTFEW